MSNFQYEDLFESAIILALVLVTVWIIERHAKANRITCQNCEQKGKPHDLIPGYCWKCGQVVIEAVKRGLVR